MSNKKQLATQQTALGTAITAAISAVASYSLRKNVDPYVRAMSGIVSGFTTSALLSFRYEPFPSFVIGSGVIVASLVVSAIDIRRQSISNIRNNDFLYELYYIQESGKGVFSIPPHQQVPHGIDGFTYKGANAVFKVSDGVYVDISVQGHVEETSIFGKFFNKSGGWKDKTWCESLAQQGDKQWLELYQRSLADI